MFAKYNLAYDYFCFKIKRVSKIWIPFFSIFIKIYYNESLFLKKSLITAGTIFTIEPLFFHTSRTIVEDI